MQDFVSPSLLNFIDEVKQPTQVREEVKPPTPPPVDTKEAATVETENQPPKKVDFKMVEAGANVVLGFCDSLQENIFKYLVNRKRERKANEITDSNTGFLKLKKAIAKAENNETNGSTIEPLSKEDVELVSMHIKVEEFINDLPFTDRERENILPHLMYIIEKNGGMIPPEVCLIMAFSTAIGARIGEISTL